MKFSIFILIFCIVGCTEQSREYCTEYKQKKIDKISIQRIPWSYDLIKSFQLHIQKSDVKFTNKMKKSVILRQVWKFKGETTQLVTELNPDESIALEYHHQKAVYLMDKSIIIGHVNFNEFHCLSKTMKHDYPSFFAKIFAKSPIEKQLDSLDLLLKRNKVSMEELEKNRLEREERNKQFINKFEEKRKKARQDVIKAKAAVDKARDDLRKVMTQAELKIAVEKAKSDVRELMSQVELKK